MNLLISWIAWTIKIPMFMYCCFILTAVMCGMKDIHEGRTDPKFPGDPGLGDLIDMNILGSLVGFWVILGILHFMSS